MIQLCVDFNYKKKIEHKKYFRILTPNYFDHGFVLG